MPYNETIDNRIRDAIVKWQQTNSRKMFGGVCHLRNGNMFCGVHKDYLILRLGESSAKEAMANAHVRPFDITGKPMKGWVMVQEKGFESEAELKKCHAKNEKSIDGEKRIEPQLQRNGRQDKGYERYSEKKCDQRAV